MGGAYIKVVEDEERAKTYKMTDDSPLNYETAMKYDGPIFMLLQTHEAQVNLLLYFKGTNILRFNFYEYDYENDDSTIAYGFVDVHEDNSIHFTEHLYTLTPAN